MALGLIFTAFALAGVAAYVWTVNPVGGTAQASGPVAMESYDADRDGRTDWIALTLTKASDGPYRISKVEITLEAPGQANLVGRDDPFADTRDPIVCTAPEAEEGLRAAERACVRGSLIQASRSWFQEENYWDLGQTLYLPCQEAPDGDGLHSVTVDLAGERTLERSLSCQQAAPLAS